MNLVSNTKYEFNIKQGKFKSIDQLINTLENLGANLENDVESAAAYDAAEYVAKLNENYQLYVSENSPEKGSAYDRSAIQFGYTRHNGQRYGVPSIYATHSKDGFNVSISGKDILYQEYGTGVPGRDSDRPSVRDYEKIGIETPYPFGEKYLIGEHIIRNYRYVNSNQLVGQKIPTWYERAIKQHIITPSNYAWHGPLGVTVGIAAGHFVYDTHSWYLDEVQSVNTKLRLGKHSFTTTLKKKYFE